MAVIAFVTFVLTVLIIVGVYWIGVERPDVVREHAVQKRLRPEGPTFVRQALIMPRTALSSMNWLDKALARAGRLIDPLKVMIDRAALKVSVGSVVLFCALLGLALGFATTYFVHVPGIPFVIAAAGAATPIFVIRHLAQRRLILFENQLPAGVELLARSLRAGHALATAMELVGKELPPPISTEFRLLFERQNYGMSMSDAFKAFAQRVPLLDARFFATAVLMQREVGGNLSEVLENLATVMRERFKVKREIRVASAHGRITAWVLALLAPVVVVALSFVAPDLMTGLVRDPVGRQMIAGAVLLQLAGLFFIRRIVDVEY